MQFVDLTLPFGMLDLPHPLPARDENFHRALGRFRIPEIQHGTPYENHSDEQSGYGGPKYFERERSFDRLGALVRRAPAILDHEIEDDRKNHGRKKQGDGCQEIIQLVDRPRDRGGLIRLKWKALHQARILTSLI